MTVAAAVAGEPREALRGRLRAAGFDEVRFAAAGGASRSLREWLDEGHHATMEWIERTAEKRMDADRVLPGVRSVILLGVSYWPGREAARPDGSAAPPRWARYALHADYHETIKPGLVAAGRLLEETFGIGREDYRAYVDTGPVLERGWAARSGLGFRGKNAMLISPRHGNWLFLAAVLTRLEIAPDEPLRPAAVRAAGEEPAGLLCGKCTRCLTACPTDAFPRPGVVDSRRCISYQTIENKGTIPRELRAAIGARVYGCDVCLEVCPWNRFAQRGRQQLLAVRHDIGELPLRDILALDAESFARIFRGTAIKRLKLAGLLRNACVVAGNSGDSGLLPTLVTLAGHESPLVRAHAVWAVQRLAGGAAEQLLQVVRHVENDVSVLAEYAPAAGLPSAS
jgi:epoxyqueuosine reductase